MAAHIHRRGLYPPVRAAERRRRRARTLAHAVVGTILAWGKGRLEAFARLGREFVGVLGVR